MVISESVILKKIFWRPGDNRRDLQFRENRAGNLKQSISVHDTRSPTRDHPFCPDCASELGYLQLQQPSCFQSDSPPVVTSLPGVCSQPLERNVCFWVKNTCRCTIPSLAMDNLMFFCRGLQTLDLGFLHGRVEFVLYICQDHKIITPARNNNCPPVWFRLLEKQTPDQSLKCLDLY